MQNLSFSTLLVFAIPSYITGFILDAVARKYLKTFIKIFRREPFEKRVLHEFKKSFPEVSINKYDYGRLYSYSILRCAGSKNKVDDFSALSKLARNLSFGFLLYLPLSIITLMIEPSSFNLLYFIGESILSLALASVLLLTADEFRKYSHSELIYSYYSQRLLDENKYYVNDPFFKDNEVK